MILTAGGIEDDEASRRGVPESPSEELREADYQDLREELRSLEPNNPNLDEIRDPNKAPSPEAVESLRREVEAARIRQAGSPDDLKDRIRNPTKQESPVWNDFENAGNGRKYSGYGSSKRYYEWDYTHNDIEVYDSKGNHRGTIDPVTGEQIKPAVPGRRIKL